MFEFLKKLWGSKTDFAALLKSGAIIIDVRSPQEYDSGHIKGSKNIPVNLIHRDVEMIKKWATPIIVVCQSGARSNMAKSILKRAHIEVYNGGSWMSLKSKI
ncbi:MAG: rhodanese-like domain-containing protein [Chitinophagaceae bacterium]|jgi:rhodanese-related sulfurtransferase